MSLKKLDPLLHSELRLKIMSLLIGIDSADFNFLLSESGATRGNLSVQINKLKDAGYLSVKKQFKNNYPHTTCKVTSKGQDAFNAYVDTLKDYLKI